MHMRGLTGKGSSGRAQSLVQGKARPLTSFVLVCRAVSSEEEHRPYKPRAIRSNRIPPIYGGVVVQLV